MSTKNLIKRTNRFDKEYTALVVSNNDPLHKGRLQVKIDAILGDIPFWVSSTLQTGSVKLIMIPDKDDVVSVKFRNKDIYSGEWELKGNTNKNQEIDPNKYGISDKYGNSIIIDKATKNISINTTAFTITANDSFVNGNFGTSVGETATIPLESGQVLIFINGILQGVQ